MMLVTLILRVSASCQMLANPGNPWTVCENFLTSVNCGYNSNDCKWGSVPVVVAPTNCNYVEASSFPITTTLTFD